MGRYVKFQSGRKEKPETNPLWRGVGCIIMVALPLISFGLTDIFTPSIAATGLVPLQLLRQVNFPAWVFRWSVLGKIAVFMMGINNLWLDVITFFILLVLLTGFSSLIFVTMLKVFGPPRYTELDAPPARIKVKKYKR